MTSPTGALNVAKKEEVKEVKYQHYNSSRQSMRMITEIGRMISFVNYQYMTCEDDLIDYLNTEIDKGLNVVIKGELLTSKEADPMAALRSKMKEELLKEIAEEAKDRALGKTKDMGNTKTKEAIASGAKPLSTTGVVTKDAS